MWPALAARLRASCLVAIVCLASTAPALAHAGSVAFWRVVPGASSSISDVLLSLDDVRSLAPELPRDAGEVPLERLEALRDAVSRHFVVVEDGVPAPSRVVRARMLPSGLLELRLEHDTHRGGALSLRSTFHRLTDDGHRVVARVGRDDASDPVVLTAAGPEFVVPRARVASQAGPFAMIRLGIAHILTGYDHLLFLACLLVPGGSWRSRLAIVTAFTLAHSLTLVLSAMGVIAPPARFVEPAIALSIAYVAVENLQASRAGGVGARWPTAFVFGLVHGLGFASLLGVLDMPLREWLVSVLSFNLGVEIGQLALVAVALPCIAWLSSSRWHRRVVQSTSVLVLGVAFVWFVERLS